MFELINNAIAQEAASTAAKQPSAFTSLIPLLLIMVVFYFFIIRPQQKKIREHQNLVKTLKKGDKVVTASGIFGSISKVIENEGLVHLEIADNVIIKIRQDMVSEVVNS